VAFQVDDAPFLVYETTQPFEGFPEFWFILSHRGVSHPFTCPKTSSPLFSFCLLSGRHDNFPFSSRSNAFVFPCLNTRLGRGGSPSLALFSFAREINRRTIRLLFPSTQSTSFLLSPVLIRVLRRSLYLCDFPDSLELSYLLFSFLQANAEGIAAFLRRTGPTLHLFSHILPPPFAIEPPLLTA